MKTLEVYQLLYAGQLTMVFDTNALFSNQRFRKLCNQINRIKDCDKKYQLNLVVPAPAHVEKLHDLKQQYREHYNFSEILKGLTDKGVSVLCHLSRIMLMWSPICWVNNFQLPKHGVHLSEIVALHALD
jgi:hypothetical protein